MTNMRTLRCLDNRLNMLSSAFRRAGSHIYGWIDLQFAAAETLQAVGFRFWNQVTPLTDGAFCHPKQIGHSLLGPVIRQHIGFTHAAQSTAC